MCRLRLGPEAPALAWLWAARAWRNREPGQKPKIWLGPAWLWPKPGLLVYMYNFTHFHLEISVNMFNYLRYSVVRLFYSFSSAGGAEASKIVAESKF